MNRGLQPTAILLIVGGVLTACANFPDASRTYGAQGEAILEPLTHVPGDPRRGREIIGGRDANCLFCHAIRETGERFMGDVGPSLSGVGTRLTPGQIRLRIVDPTRLNVDAAMPAYHRVHGLDQVASSYRGKPILSAQEVEDVVAYLLTLK